MVRRVHLEADRFVLSRPGFAASPSMPNEQKILDSEWGYAGMIIASGEALDPSPADAGYPYREGTSWATPWIISIPDCGFTPTLLWGTETSRGTDTIFYQSSYVAHFLDPPRIVNNNSIRIDRRGYGGGVRGRLGQPTWIGGEDWSDMKFVYHVIGF